MRFLTLVLTILGVWLLLAVPAALFVGRLLRVGGERAATGPAPVRRVA